MIRILERFYKHVAKIRQINVFFIKNRYDENMKFKSCLLYASQSLIFLLFSHGVYAVCDPRVDTTFEKCAGKIDSHGGKIFEFALMRYVEWAVQAHELRVDESDGSRFYDAPNIRQLHWILKRHNPAGNKPVLFLDTLINLLQREDLREEHTVFIKHILEVFLGNAHFVWPSRKAVFPKDDRVIKRFLQGVSLVAKKDADLGRGFALINLGSELNDSSVSDEPQGDVLMHHQLIRGFYEDFVKKFNANSKQTLHSRVPQFSPAVASFVRELNLN